MEPLASSVFSSSCWKLPSLFPFTTATRFSELNISNVDSVFELQVVASHTPGRWVVYNNLTLFIFSNEGIFDRPPDIIAEVDFSANIIAACWDIFDCCISVLDASGCLHLLDTEGSIILSKKMVSTAKDEQCTMVFSLMERTSTLQQLVMIMKQSENMVCVSNIDLSKCSNGEAVSSKVVLETFKSVQVSSCPIPSSNWRQMIASRGDDDLLRIFATNHFNNDLEQYTITNGKQCETSDLCRIPIHASDFAIANKILLVLTCHSSSCQIVVLDTNNNSTLATYTFDGIVDLKFLSISPAKSNCDVKGWRLLLYSAQEGNLYNLSLISYDGRMSIISHGYEAFGDKLFLNNNVVGPVFLSRDADSLHAQIGTSTTFSMQLLDECVSAILSGSANSSSNSFAAALASCVRLSVTCVESIDSMASWFSQLINGLRFPTEVICCLGVIFDRHAVSSLAIAEELLLISQTKLSSFLPSAPAIIETQETLASWKAVIRLSNEFQKKFDQVLVPSDLLEAAMFSNRSIRVFDNLFASNSLNALMFLAEQGIWRPDFAKIVQFVESIDLGCNNEVFCRCISLQMNSSTVASNDLTSWNVWEALFIRAKDLADWGDGQSSLLLTKMILKSAEASTHPDSCGYALQFLQDVKECEEVLTLMMAAQNLLAVPCSFSDARRFGLLGVLLEAIDAEDENGMNGFIKQKLKAICETMKANPDDMLLAWLDRTMQDRLLSPTTGLGDLDGSAVGANISISKLMRVAYCVENIDAAGKAMLKIFLLPDVESAAISDKNVFDCVLEKTVAVMSVTKGNLHDKLQEALRSFRMKCLAIYYSIEGFDPRSKLQVGALIAMIINRKLTESWVEDIVFCAYDGEVERFNLRPHLIREIIQKEETGKLSQLEDILTALALTCPPSVFVSMMMNCVEYFANEINEIFDFKSGYSGKERNDKASSLLQAGTILCKHLQYVLEDKEYSDHITLKAMHHYEFVFKRMLVLQDMGLFLSFDQTQDSSFCKKMARAHLESVFVPLFKGSGSVDVNVVHRSYATLEKVCNALDVSKQFAVRELVHLCIANGRKELALEVMTWNATELEQIERSSSFQTDDQSTRSVAEEDDQISIDLDDLVEQGLLLSQTALKTHQTVSNYGYYADLQTVSSKDGNFERQAYSAVERLMKIAVRIGENRALCLAIDTVNATNLTRRVMERIEATAYHKDEANKCGQELPSITLAVPEDGLLMQKDVILPALSQYLMRELLNKQLSYGNEKLFTSGKNKNSAGKKSSAIVNLKKATSLSEAAYSSKELERLVEALQRLENHNLAVYTLFQSWSINPVKVQLLKTSLVSLVRKLLSYRSIHETFAIACLSCLPMETMVKELRAMVPSIQNDYGRLHTLALIGEELSYLWDQEGLLLLFQSLQTNAKWWNVLSSIGIKVDMKLFQSADLPQRENYLLSLVPDILRTSQLNLELALDYCRSFDIHTEKAILQYIQLMIEKSDFNELTAWASKITSAAAGLEEPLLLRVLTQSLFKVHPLHYEKIVFVTKWIADLLPTASQGDDDEDHYQHQNQAIVNEEDEENNFYRRNNVSTIQEEESGYDTADTAAAKMSKKASQKAQPKSEEKMEIDAVTCEKILSLINYLQTLKFSNNCLDAFRGDLQFGHVYRDVKGEAALRMPVWPLRSEPWSVLDHVLATADPTLLEKIVPLCFLLEIDKQDFDARSLFALYRCMKATLKEQHVVNGVVSSVKLEEMRHDFTTQLRERIRNIFTRLAVWDLIFQFEAVSGESNNNREYALFALQTSLQEIDIASKTMHSTELESARIRLDSNARQLQLYDHLLSLLTVFGFPAVHSVLMNLTKGEKASERLLSTILELLVESLWSLQMQPLHHAVGGGSYVLGKDWLTLCTSLNVAVVNKLKEAKSKIIEICSYLHHSGSGKQQQFDCLDLSISEFISRMLVESSTEFRSSRDNNKNNLLEESQMINAQDFWRNDDKSHAHIATFAEMRRREDAFLGFGIAIALELHTDDMKRDNIVQQLHGIVRLLGNKPMKRLTTRSRLRAVWALLRLGYGQSDDLVLYSRYLYCAAEMHEIRLTTSDEALMNGLGLHVMEESNKALSEISSSVRTLNTRAIIMTWLHDEGEHDDVVELARDVHFLSPRQDWQVLIKLLKHMLENDMNRVFLSTITIMENKGLLKKLLWDPMQPLVATKLLSMAEGVCNVATTVVSNTNKEDKLVSWPTIFTISTESSTAAVPSQGDSKPAVNKLNSKNISALPVEKKPLEAWLIFEIVLRLCASFRFYQDNATVAEELASSLTVKVLKISFNLSNSEEDKRRLALSCCHHLLSDAMLHESASKVRITTVAESVVQVIESAKVAEFRTLLEIITQLLTTEELGIILETVCSKITKIREWMDCLVDFILSTTTGMKNTVSYHCGVSKQFIKVVIQHCVQMYNRPEHAVVAKAAIASCGKQAEFTQLMRAMQSYDVLPIRKSIDFDDGQLDESN